MSRRTGARALVAQAVETEVAGFLAEHADKRTDDGRQRLVRHGHLPQRTAMTGIGPARSDAWPDADRRTRLVFIVRDVDPAVIRGLFRAFLGTPAVDQPDAAASMDNPLVPFGGFDR
jgi:hypothetical protein